MCTFPSVYNTILYFKITSTVVTNTVIKKKETQKLTLHLETPKKKRNYKCKKYGNKNFLYI